MDNLTNAITTTTRENEKEHQETQVLPTHDGRSPAQAAATPDQESGPVANANANHDPTLRGFRLIAVAVGVCFGALMMSLDIAIIGTALPSIMSDFGDTTQIAWYPAAFTLATCALTPVAGKMAAVFPLDLVYSSFTIVFLAGSILCGWAPNSAAFIAGRAVAGIGAAGVSSNGITILATVAPTGRKPALMGAGAACFALGLVVAPLLGGAFTARLTWRWCFWINIPFNLLTIVVVSTFLRSPQGRTGSVGSRIKSLDLVGCFLFVPGVFMLLLALEWGANRKSWSDPTIIGLFVGAGVTFIVFTGWEWSRAADAMIPGSVIGRRTVAFACLFASTQMGGLTISSYYLPAWFQAVQGVNPLDSGIRMLPTVLTQIVTTIIASGLARRMRYYNPWFFLASVFLCTSSALYTTFTAFSTPPSHWIGYQVIQGFSAGFGMQMSSLAVQLELKDSPELLPVGIALVIFVQYLGASILQVVAGTVFNSELSSQLMRPELGMSPFQKNLQLSAGLSRMREVTAANFPQLLDHILESYNAAITRVFFVPVAAAAAGFLLAFGIKWTAVEQPPKSSTDADAESLAGDATVNSARGPAAGPPPQVPVPSESRRSA
ncbi:hypothetical protein RB595_006784 [Gaeumannomyces hyphopodioides]